MSTIITQPKAYLVTKPSVDWEQVAAFLADEGVPGIPDSIRAGEDESAAIAEISARLCYMSYGRGRRDIADFINNLLRFKDGSVFEHINYGFVFTGVSRSLTHELVRHRAGFAYSQRSQRYVDESGSRFVAPPVLADAADDEVQAVFEAAIESAAKGYDELVRRWSLPYPASGSSLQLTTARQSGRRRARFCQMQPRPRYSLPPTCGRGGTSSKCEAAPSPMWKYADLL